MRKWIGPILLTAFSIYEMANVFRDFIASDGIHYFVRQPSRLLLVLAIGVAGGLCALVYERLSPRVRCLVKLWAFALAAVSSFLFASYLYYEFHFGLMTKPPVLYVPRFFEVVPLFPLGASLFFSLFFYLNLKRKIEA